MGSEEIAMFVYDFPVNEFFSILPPDSDTGNLAIIPSNEPSSPIGGPIDIILGTPVVQNAPIMRLPDEALAEIFISGIYNLGMTDTYHLFKQRIMLVTRRWCNVVLSTPALWTFIQLIEEIPRWVLDLQIQRSGVVDMDVSIHEWPGIEASFDLVIPHAARWRYLGATFCDNTLFHTFLRALHALSVPRLKQLTVLKVLNHHQETESDRFSVFSGGAPALEEVHLEGVSPFLCTIPLGPVKKLDLVDFSPSFPINGQDFSATLHSLTSLTSLTITKCPQASLCPAIYLPSLRSLKLQGGYTRAQSPLTLLQNLTAPQLEIVIFNDTINTDFGDLLESQLPLTFPTVRSLTLARTSIFPEMFARLSRVFGAATHVCIIFANSIYSTTETRGAYCYIRLREDLMLEALDSNFHAAWPGLHTLTAYPLDMEARNYVEVRKDIGRPISKLRVFGGSSIELDILREQLQVEALESYHPLTIEKAPSHTEAAYRASGYTARTD